jgi:UDP-N-acetylmuramoyl-L-alanyl-D-glutamate--2,6-diaminopimelate ligase
MKLLKDIIYRSPLVDIKGTTNVAIASISADSRRIEKHSLFIASKGTLNDSHQFIEEVIKKGAIAIICENFPEIIHEHITYVQVKDSKYALGLIASNFYDNPSEKLKVIGVTGTNGKTTIATLLYHLFKKLGYTCGLISTVKNIIGKNENIATHTTPDAISLNQFFAKMLEAGCTHCFMEVSSHALDQHRVAGVNFTGAIFSNITHDHLDYHKTFDNYIKAKKMLFEMLPSTSFALINKDDKNGEIMLQNSKGIKKSYSLHSVSDFKAKILENHFSGLFLNIDGTEVWTKLIGSFNASNLLAVYGAAILLKEQKINVLSALSTVNSVDGRFQYIRSNSGITGIVDYAHTPDALKNVLNTINDIKNGNEQIITLIGCGGDRDPFKRPEMAKIACEKSDRAIFTSDNPRSEDPAEIIKQMEKGCDPVLSRKYVSIVDRKEAIKTAIMIAKPGDIILVAGKGHEKYQEVNGVKHDFDDLEILKELFETLAV